MARNSKLLFCLHYNEIKQPNVSNLLNYIYTTSSSSETKQHQDSLRDSFRLLLNKRHYVAILAKKETRHSINTALRQLGLIDHEVNSIFIIQNTDNMKKIQQQFNIQNIQSIYLITTDLTAGENSLLENYQVIYINSTISDCLKKVSEVINQHKSDLPDVKILREPKKEVVYEKPPTNPSEDRQAKLIIYLNKKLTRLVPLGNLAQLSIAFFLGLSLATGTLSALLTGVCLMSAVTVIDVFRYKIQSQRTRLQLYRLENVSASLNESELETYNIGHESKNWVPYLKSFISLKTYKNHNAFEAGLADATISEFAINHNRKGL